MSEKRLRLRAGFDRVAELYDRARPDYPPVLFDELVALAGVGRVLEIGCGPGRATIALAQRGYSVLAVELAPNMAAIATANLAPYDSVRVEVGDFDRWTGDGTTFDMVFAATAFHWLDPATRNERTAALLRPGGVLATIATWHVDGGTSEFYVDQYAIYRRYGVDEQSAERPPTAQDVPYHRNLGPHYQQPVFRRHEFAVDYSTSAYLDLLPTYSRLAAMPRLARDGLLRDVGALIDGRYGGRVTKRYMSELRMARVVG